MEVLQPFCAPAPVSDPPLKTKKVFPFARVGFPLLQLVTAASCPSSLLSLNKPIFYHKGGETLEWVAQRGSGGPIPGTFKARLDGALSNLVWLTISLLTAGGLA